MKSGIEPDKAPPKPQVAAGGDSVDRLVGLSCRHCGRKPKIETSTVQQKDEGYSRLVWIQCACGIRTIAVDGLYNLKENKAKLIAIWNQPNASDHGLSPVKPDPQ